MGALYDFRCGSCGYQAEVSGGEDRGMASATTTILCETCQELYDVAISDDPITRKPERETPVRCPVSSAHTWRLWQHPGPCPQCGAAMTRGAATLIWD